MVFWPGTVPDESSSLETLGVSSLLCFKDFLSFCETPLNRETFLKYTKITLESQMCT